MATMVQIPQPNLSSIKSIQFKMTKTSVLILCLSRGRFLRSIPHQPRYPEYIGKSPAIELTFVAILRLFWLRRLAQNTALGPATFPLINAAQAFPVICVNLGYGVFISDGVFVALFGGSGGYSRSLHARIVAQSRCPAKRSGQKPLRHHRSSPTFTSHFRTQLRISSAHDFFSSLSPRIKPC